MAAEGGVKAKTMTELRRACRLAARQQREIDALLLVHATWRVRNRVREALATAANDDATVLTTTYFTAASHKFFEAEDKRDDGNREFRRELLALCQVLGVE